MSGFKPLAFAALVVLAFAAHGAPLARELPIGDSIAVGVAAEARTTGYAKVGMNPKEVLEYIASTPIVELHGAVVVLSTGLSNDQNQFVYVPLQIAALKAAGAHVILLGVGTSIDQGTNQKLSTLARAEDIPFLWGWAPVHPDYRELLQHVRRIEREVYDVRSA